MSEEQTGNMTDAVLCEGKRARILKTDAEYLVDKYSEFASSDNLKKYICLAFRSFSIEENPQKKQELRDKFGIGTENEFEEYLKQEASRLPITPSSPDYCTYCNEKIIDWPIGTYGYPQNRSYFGLCRRHSKELDFVESLLEGLLNELPEPIAACCSTSNK